MSRAVVLARTDAELDVERLRRQWPGWARRWPVDRLCAERWFAGTARGVVAIEGRDLFAFELERGFGALSILAARDRGGTVVSYHLPLAIVRAEAEAGDREDETPRIVAAGVEWKLRFPRCDADFWGALLERVGQGRQEKGLAGSFRFRSLGSSAAARSDFDRRLESRPAPARPDARLLGVDQSNTSVVLAERLLFKVYRRLWPGLHPEVEVYRLLSESTTFDGIPTPRGEVEYRSRDGELWALGLLQDYEAGSRDAWSLLVEALSGGGPSSEPARARWLEELAERLGALTAELHLALFDPEGTGAAHSRRWEAGDGEALRAGIERRAERCRDLDPEAARLLGRLAPGLDAAHRSAAPEAAGWKIRVHGDYHLGQVLERDGALRIVDFEGEPTRPIAERRELASPLKDVAGMLRSFDYAAAVAGLGGGRPPSPSAEDWRVSWRERARASFLEHYRARLARSPAAARLVPVGAAGRSLLFLHEIEKALYEIEYEAIHRPELLSVALSGLGRVLDRA